MVEDEEEKDLEEDFQDEDWEGLKEDTWKNLKPEEEEEEPEEEELPDEDEEEPGEEEKELEEEEEEYYEEPEEEYYEEPPELEEEKEVEAIALEKMALEDVAKIGPLTGRLFEFLIVIFVILAFLVFFATNHWEVTTIHSFSVGYLLIVGMVCVTVMVLLFGLVPANIAKGDAFSLAGNHDGAIEHYDKAIKLDRHSKKAWTAKGAALRMRSHDKDNLLEALRCQNRALKIDKKYSMAWVNKGNVLFNLGEVDKALKCYDTAIEYRPDYATAWLNKGELLVKLGRRNEAQECLEKIRSLS